MKKPPPDPAELSRRERQIMDAVYALGEATVNQVAESIPDPPTPMAVRRMMHILEEKSYLKRCGEGREVVYLPCLAREKAGDNALQRVLETFFGGSLENALATHLVARRDGLGSAELDRIAELIAQSKKEGR
jgi:predicted transcriptional regulator